MEEEIASDHGHSSRAEQPDRNDSSVSGDSVTSDDFKLSIEYSMDFEEKSLCYIFNHTKYAPELEISDRKNAEMDCTRIEECFERLNFDVRVFTDEPACEIKYKLKCVSKQDHSKRAAFVCFFMTHGEDGKLYAFNTKYPVKQVLEYFSSDNPSLNGKPKLFFIQACRGHKAQSGIPVKKNEYTDGVTDPWNWSKIPGLSDFFIGYSTVKGYVAFKNKKGSVFMQALCKYIERFAAYMDLLQIMTYVNQEVSQFESYSLDKELDKKKQMPCVWFTLTKLFKFPVMHSGSS